MTPPNQRLEAFRAALLPWFNENRRGFYWRAENASDYEVIVSELLLQRTQAGTVERFLCAFLSRFPSWNDIADASEESLAEFLKPIGLWRRRAATLRLLAIELTKRDESFPEDRGDIEALPGVGQYVANAIELFCFGRARPLLDSSMARVLERYFGPRKLADIRYDPYLQSLAARIVQSPNPAQVNWAILDLAALVCTSRTPNCEDCPLSAECLVGRGLSDVNVNRRSNVQEALNDGPDR